MKKIITFTTTLILTFFIAASAQAKTDIEYILDFSGSMKKMADGEMQIDSARKALIKSITNIPGETYVALRVYGHKVEQVNKTASCKDTELLVPFTAVKSTQIKDTINSLTPKGYTPIAYSLEQSSKDFDSTREAKKVIILLSDGEETCGGDPVAVLKKLKAQGFEVVVHAIGFNVDAKTRKQLEAIALTTGGKYFDANSAADLNNALQKATQQSLVIDKTTTTYGSKIRGGDSYETAVQLDINKEYKLDHHQRKNEFDYFYIDLKKGQHLAAVLKTLGKGISMHSNPPKVNNNPYAGMQIHGSERNKLKTATIIGSTHATKNIKYSIPQDGRYYILIGSTYSAMNADHTNFAAFVETKGDLGSNIDAGDTIKSSLAIDFKKYPQNYLGGADFKDIYTFSAKKGEQLTIGIIPNDEINYYYALTIMNPYKQKLFSAQTKTNEGMKTSPWIASEDDTYYLIVESKSYSDKKKLGSYLLDLKKTSDITVEK
jgi:hypothetical protein